jgi:hypothetical protein
MPQPCGICRDRLVSRKLFGRKLALADDMVASVQAQRGVREQSSQPFLALDQRPRPEILAFEIQKIEQEEDQRRRMPLSEAS